jgi:gamma-glutamylcyclotransferase (GGCT)/AIG2-like uncharacterized protein YtfP
MNHLVFVYGSLKRGYGNHYILDRSAKFVARTRTVGRSYYMVSFGPFPAVMKIPSSFKEEFYNIEGEVYEVDEQTLMSLDALEGNGYLYTREKVGLASGHTAWMYILNGYTDENEPNGRVKVTRNHSQVWLPATKGISYVIGRERF